MKTNPMPRSRGFLPARPSWVLLRGMVAVVMSAMLTSCLAQKADLDRFQREFEVKLARMDQEMDQARQKSQSVLDKQKAELQDLIKARAKINSELRSLKEENLTRLSGSLETEAHRLDQMNRRVDDLSEELAVLGQRIQKNTAEQETKMTDLGKRFDDALVKQQSAMTGQLTGFQQSLQGFKDALAGLDTRLQEERTRSTTAEAELRKEFEGKQTALQTKLDTDTQTLKNYLENDVKMSVDSVAKAITEVNGTLGTKIQSQEQLVSENKTELMNLKSANEASQQHVQGLTQSVAQLRDLLGQSGTELGGRLEEQGHQLDQTSAGMKQIQEQLAGLSTKLSTDTEALRGYLEKDVRPSLASIVVALDEEKVRSSEEISRLDTTVQGLKQSSEGDLKEMRKQIQGQDAHIQELGQSVKSFREVLNTITEQLGKRSDEQLQIAGQLTARMDRLEKDQVAEGGKQSEDTQAISEHLAEVTASVQSTQKGLEQVKETLSAQLQEQIQRIDDHERRLSESVPDSGDLTSVQEKIQAQATHLNQVTDSLAQLKNIINTIGTKLGEKVDAHDSQLATLSQQVQSLTKKRAK